MGNKLPMLMLLLAAVSTHCVAANDVMLQDDPSLLLAMPTELDQVGRIMTPVMINGRGPFRLLIDTGANRMAFSQRLAEELGIDYRNGRSIMINGVTGRARVPLVSIDSMEAGALVLRDQKIPVIDQRIMADADGILGIAALTDKQLLVDFRNNRVLVTNSQPIPPRMIRLKAKRLPSGLLVTQATVGRVQTWVVIDTGAERTLGNLALMKAMNRQHDEDVRVDVLGTTPEIAPGSQVVVRNIELGEVRIRNSLVAFGDFHVFEVWKLERQPAMILGMDVIGRVDIFVIDFRRLEIGFRS